MSIASRDDLLQILTAELSALQDNLVAGHDRLVARVREQLRAAADKRLNFPTASGYSSSEIPDGEVHDVSDAPEDPAVDFCKQASLESVHRSEQPSSGVMDTIMQTVQCKRDNDEIRPKKSIVKNNTVCSAELPRARTSEASVQPTYSQDFQPSFSQGSQGNSPEKRVTLMLSHDVPTLPAVAENAVGREVAMPHKHKKSDRVSTRRVSALDTIGSHSADSTGPTASPPDAPFDQERASLISLHMSRASSKHGSNNSSWQDGDVLNKVAERYEVADCWRECMYAENRHTKRFLSFATMKTVSTADGELHADAEEEFIQAGPCCRPFIRHPNSWHTMCWEIFSLFLIAYDFVVIPLSVFSLPDHVIFPFMNWLIRIFWTCDCVLSFFTGYVDAEGRRVTKPSMVAGRYGKEQLPIDLVVVLLNWLELVLSGGRLLAVVKSWRIIRVVRLARLRRAIELVEHCGNDGLSLFISISRTGCLMCALTHLIACAWYGLGTWSEEDGWVRRDGAMAFSIADRYTMSFHFALGMFFGEPLILPSTIPERTFVIVVLFFVFMISVWIVASLTTAMTRLQIIASRTSGQFSALSRFLAANNISRSLTLKVARNAQRALAEKQRNAPESTIELLKVISMPLMTEVRFEMHSPALFVHPFFACYNEVNPRGIRRTCYHAIKIIDLSKGDVLFSDMEKSIRPQMYIVLDGWLSYVKGGQTEVIHEGHWISEAELWVVDWIHHGKLFATSDCKILSVDALIFQEVVSGFPSKHAGLYAQVFVQALNESDSPIHTDVQIVTGQVLYMCEASFPDEYPFVRQVFNHHSNAIGSMMSGQTTGSNASRAEIIINGLWARFSMLSHISRASIRRASRRASSFGSKRASNRTSAVAQQIRSSAMTAMEEAEAMNAVTPCSRSQSLPVTVSPTGSAAGQKDSA
eukprot:gnl/TRDRNA2_/TRDRNA2_175821_c0_seq4.p1 gnl/TRDRNA2_/TRDRNA2_175821_c0~~gnl/TRDRNA2_/TRDRNA2_175821_c0_seq4.p1  ORF type:complete len:923 (+),score=86.24 gnl/TRDRNA2_/TRDRNA2_175821_c0_seq4:86-2854(+)